MSSEATGCVDVDVDTGKRLVVLLAAEFTFSLLPDAEDVVRT